MEEKAVKSGVRQFPATRIEIMDAYMKQLLETSEKRHSPRFIALRAFASPEIAYVNIDKVEAVIPAGTDMASTIVITPNMQCRVKEKPDEVLELIAKRGLE